MNVLLTRPFADNRDISRVMPLGLIAVGTILKREGYNVRIADLRLSQNPESDLTRVMQEFSPDIVGIGLMTVESDYAFKMAARIKEIDPNCMLIFGGPHCAHEPEFILHDPNVDMMVVGESELTIPELMEALKNKTDLETVKGICSFTIRSTSF